MVNGPEKAYGLDWITEFENGTYYHKAEPRHATLAITETSIERMRVIKQICGYTQILMNKLFYCLIQNPNVGK